MPKWKKVICLLLCVLIFFASSHCARKPKEKRKLVLIGIDAGSWNVINPLLEQGKLPNFKYLIDNGASGYLTTFKRTNWSPVLWTSIITGKLPEKHGIQGYVSPKGFPINSTMRKVKDLPELLSQNGYSVGFVGFWGSWPAEKVRGVMVSDLFSLERYKESSRQANYTTTDYSYLLPVKQVTYPEDFVKEIYPLLLTPKQVPRETYARLILFNDQEWERFDNLQMMERKDFESLLKFALVSDINFYLITRYIQDNEKPEVLAVYLEGVDIVGHFFWRYMEPEYFSPVPKRDIERFKDAIRNYYQLVDEWLGELILASPQGTAFLIISDHGMARVPKEGGYRGMSLHSGTHTTRPHPDGIIIFSGPGIKKGHKIEKAHILDITPTVLYYLGLPVGKDMDGKVILEAFEPDFVKKCPVRKIKTYDKKPRKVKETSSPLDEEILNKLRSIGYIQ